MGGGLSQPREMLAQTWPSIVAYRARRPLHAVGVPCGAVAVPVGLTVTQQSPFPSGPTCRLAEKYCRDPPTSWKKSTSGGQTPCWDGHRMARLLMDKPRLVVALHPDQVHAVGLRVPGNFTPPWAEDVAIRCSAPPLTDTLDGSQLPYGSPPGSPL